MRRVERRMQRLDGLLNRFLEGVQLGGRGEGAEETAGERWEITILRAIPGEDTGEKSRRREKSGDKLKQDTPRKAAVMLS